MLGPVSFSQIHLFDQCPLAWQYRYQKILPIVEQGTPLQIGSAMHSFMEQFYKHLAKIGKSSDPTFGRQLAKEISNKYVSKEVSETVLELATYIGENEYVEIGLPVDCNIEKQLAVNSLGKQVNFFDESAIYRGVLDLCYEEGNGNWYVVDYKFGMKERKPADDMQMESYAYLLLRHLESFERIPEEIICRIDNRRTRKRHDSSDDMHIEPNESLKTRVEEWIFASREKIESAIEKDEFQGKRQALCEYCSYRSFCSELQKSEDLEKRIMDFIALKTKASVEAAYLKRAIEGTIEIDSARYGHYQKAQRSYNGQMVWDFLGKFEGGANEIIENLHINQTTAEKICRSLGEDPKILDEIAAVKQKNEFGFLPEK